MRSKPLGVACAACFKHSAGVYAECGALCRVSQTSDCTLRYTVLQAPHPTKTVVGCSAPVVRAATSLPGCPPAGRCFLCRTLYRSIHLRYVLYHLTGAVAKRLGLGSLSPQTKKGSDAAEPFFVCGDGRTRTAVQTPHQRAFYTLSLPLVFDERLPGDRLSCAYPLNLNGA